MAIHICGSDSEALMRLRYPLLERLYELCLAMSDVEADVIACAECAAARQAGESFCSRHAGIVETGWAAMDEVFEKLDDIPCPNSPYADDLIIPAQLLN